MGAWTLFKLDFLFWCWWPAAVEPVVCVAGGRTTLCCFSKFDGFASLRALIGPPAVVAC